MNRKLEWWVLTFLGIAAFILGFVGYNTYFTEQGTYRHFIDLIFHTIKLFAFDIVDEYASPLPLPLEIARFLAPGVLIYTALKTMLFLARREFKYFRMKSYKNHIIVSSINSYSRYFIKDLIDKKEKIIVVTEGDDITNFEDLERKGVVVIQGSLNDYKVLENSAAAKARFIVLLNENDEHNISTAISAFDYLKEIRNNYETIIYAHISDYNKLNELKEISLFDKVVGEHTEKFNYEIRVFSMNERSSRIIFNKYSPDQFTPITKKEDPPIHIAVFGSNEFTQSMIVHFAKMSHYINLKKLKITLFYQGEKFTKKLHQNFPQISNVIDLIEIEEDLELFETTKFEEINSKNKFSTVYLTCKDDELSLSIFNKLTKINLHDKLHVVIALIKPDGVLSRWFPDGEVKNIVLHKFNTVTETFTSDALLSEDIDKLAKIIHQDYLNDNRQKGKLDPSKPTHKEWEFLSADIKDQNRLQADHIWVKLRNAGIDFNSDFTFDDKNLIELLSEVEHNRWAAHMLLSGWTFSETRDDNYKKHPDLVPYEKLSEPVKDYDRNTIKNIPKLVKEYFK